MRRKEACQRQAYKQKEIPKETRFFEEGGGLSKAGLQTTRPKNTLVPKLESNTYDQKNHNYVSTAKQQLSNN